MRNEFIYETDLQLDLDYLTQLVDKPHRVVVKNGDEIRINISWSILKPLTFKNVCLKF